MAETSAFIERFGAAIENYLQENVTIEEAVTRLVADENSLRVALRPFLAGGQPTTTEFLHGLLNEGWTPQAVAQVLETAEILRRDPESLALANFILEQSGLGPLDEVAFINALNGVGPADVIEALNTATAARALQESGLELSDDDVLLIMELVDTSDRLLTVEGWRQLAQELAFNVFRFGTELDEGKLGITRDELVAAAFGQAEPGVFGPDPGDPPPRGRSSGEVLGLLARFERDRRAASAGTGGVTGFLDAEGRLRVQGLSGL